MEANHSLQHATARQALHPVDRHPRCQVSGAAPFLLGSALLGTIGIFVHQAAADPLTTTWFRCAFGLIGLTLWLVWHRQLTTLRLTRTTIPWVITAGLLMVLAWILFFFAIERVSTGVAVVLFHIQPLWVLALGALWFKEPVSRHRITWVSLAMVGLVLATGAIEQTSVAGVSGMRYGLGVVACLIGALCTAGVTLIASCLNRMPPGVLAWWQCALGTVVLLVWPTQHGWPQWGASWLWLTGLGLIHTGLAYTLMYAGMARLSTGRIAVLQFIYPGVAIGIDWLYFNQPLNQGQLLGIVLMSLAIWFAERKSDA